jgi:hypothetical protein
MLSLPPNDKETLLFTHDIRPFRLSETTEGGVYG